MDKFLKVCLRSQISFNRSISCSSVLRGKRNFRKFVLPNRGSEEFRKRQEENPHPDIFPIRFGVKKTYVLSGRKRQRVEVPEMIPELIVPDLTAFELKPYVSYKTYEVVQSEFTAKDLFNAVYRKKIIKDFNEKKLDEDGNPLEPSGAEQMTAEQAAKFAKMTGSDLFDEDKPWEKQQEQQEQQ